MKTTTHIQQIADGVRKHINFVAEMGGEEIAWDEYITIAQTALSIALEFGASESEWSADDARAFLTECGIPTAWVTATIYEDAFGWVFY